MKLTKDTQLIIHNAVDLGVTLGIENIVIDTFSLRGENKELGIAAIMPTKGIPLEFNAIGLSRIPLFKSRLEMMRDGELRLNSAARADGESIISSIEMVRGRSKIGFKCQDPRLINAPKAINDPVYYEFKLNSDDLETITKGISVMAAETINFTMLDGVMTIKISDIQGDMFSYALDAKITSRDTDNNSLSKTYRCKTIRSVLAFFMRKDNNSELDIAITRRGVMRVMIHDIMVYIFPER